MPRAILVPIRRGPTTPKSGTRADVRLAAIDKDVRRAMATGRPLDPRETTRSQHYDRAPIGPILSRDESALVAVG